MAYHTKNTAQREVVRCVECRETVSRADALAYRKSGWTWHRDDAGAGSDSYWLCREHTARWRQALREIETATVTK